MSSCQQFSPFRSGFLLVCCSEFELFILNPLRPVNEDNNFSGTTDLLTSAVLIAGLFLFLPISFSQSHADTHRNLNHVLSLKRHSVSPPIMTLVSEYNTCCYHSNLVSSYHISCGFGCSTCTQIFTQDKTLSHYKIRRQAEWDALENVQPWTTGMHLQKPSAQQ